MTTRGQHRTEYVGRLLVGDIFFDPEAGSTGWTVVGPVQMSINMQLFPEPDENGQSGRCVVVPVAYPDGGRGSRLFKQTQKLTIIRPIGDVEEMFNDGDEFVRDAS